MKIYEVQYAEHMTVKQKPWSRELTSAIFAYDSKQKFIMNTLRENARQPNWFVVSLHTKLKEQLLVN